MDVPQFQRAEHPTARLTGQSPAMVALRTQIRHLARFDTVGSAAVPTVLLHGETGVGKGLVARVVHDSGPRAAGPFVDVNCAAIPETMLEAELFGFEPGAFTDAKRAKPGLFEAASGGTLFLDEIDAFPLALQGKLLTAIEAKRVRRLGAVAARAVDVKLIAATNADLQQHVASGRFRMDLYHRLAVVVLTLPPLRTRGEDILALAQTFLQQYSIAHRVPPKRLHPAAAVWLRSYAWPGNVRELSHAMERVTLLHVGEEVEVVTLAALCQPLAPVAASGEETGRQQILTGADTATAAGSQASAPALPAEAEQIRQALVQAEGNVVRAARILGVSRDTIRYRMRRYGIAHPRPTAAAAAISTRPRQTTARQRSPRSQAAGWTNPIAASHEAMTVREGALPLTSWEQKPVAVLALELSWPALAVLDTAHDTPWTMVAHWEQEIQEKVWGFGGVLLQHTAALLTWVFGLPQALEQLPQRVVHAALAIRQMVAAAQPHDRAPGPEVRLAAHLGLVLVDPQAPDPTAHLRPVGDTLTLPVRLLGQARPGDIVVSPEVGRLVDGWVALEARALRRHAGDPEVLEGYVVVDLRPGRIRQPPPGRRTRSPLVGREREQMLLEAVLRQVTAAHGQVVGIVGEAGLGKSRLLEEFRQHLGASQVAYAAGQCLAYGSASPYLPVAELLRECCGLAEGDSLEASITKVGAGLQTTGLDPEMETPYLLHLLGMPVASDQFADLSAEALKGRTFETLQQLLLNYSRQQPLVLAVENLHWIDPTSEAFLASLVERLAGVPMLVLTTYRPGYHPPWLEKSYAMQIALAPLGPDDSRQVMRSVLRQTALEPVLEQQLLAKAQGNPLFLEELAHSMAEQERASPGGLRVPDTIHAVLAARMDRLPAFEKHLLQAAAVIGVDVSLPLLQAVAERPEEALLQGLRRLQTAEFLYETRVLPTRAYTFKHVLTQEVAYQALLPSVRQQVHQRTAQVLVEQFPTTVDTQPELVAHHYTEAGLMVQALAYWQRAGQCAVERSGHREAISHLTKGLEVLHTFPDSRERARQELALHIALGASLTAIEGYGAPEVQRAYTRAQALCQEVGDTSQLLPVLFGLWRFYVQHGQLQTARALGEQCLTLAQRMRDPVYLLRGHNTLGVTLFYLGELSHAWTHLEQGESLSNPQQLRSPPFVLDPKAACRAYAALVLWCLGYPDQALRKSQEALSLAQGLAHPHSLAFILVIDAWLHQLRREAHVVLERAEAAVTLSTEQGFALWAAVGTFWQGWILAEGGQEGEGIAHMRQGFDAWRATGADVWQPHMLALLAEVQGKVGRAEAGLHTLAEALTLVNTTGERFYEAEMYRLQGELLLLQAIPEAQQVEACFHQALAIARHQAAKSLELRAAMSLSRLWQRQGKLAEACQLLAEVYGWFTEGFDTADLQEAKMLLDALA